MNAGDLNFIVMQVPTENEIYHRDGDHLYVTMEIPLVDALISAAGASGNYVYRTAVMAIRNEVVAGMQINVAMRTVDLFPDMVIQMVMIGEESGAIDDMLSKVATIFEQEVDDAVAGLSQLLEPLIMVFLGTIIGGLVVAMYLPIFKLGAVV